MLPTLVWAAGDEEKVIEVKPITGAEDFSFFQKEIPGFYFFLGVNKEGVGPYEAASNHSPYFYANEDALIVGVRALAGLAWDYLSAQARQ
jgi:amidohydrolase